MTVLRPYQIEAVESALREFKEVSSTLLAMPTGTGKTLTACELIRRQQGRTMWLTHREELVHQSAAAIEKALGTHPEIEKAERKASQSGFSNCVVATVQTLISGKNGDRRMAKFSPHDFDLLVLDEAHRSVSDSWRTVVDYFRQNKDLKILGLTATPKRADEEALGQIFESVAFEYPILQAIHDGYLVPVQQQVVKVEGLDFSHIKTTAGDLNLGELAREMEREKNPMEIAGSTIEIIGNRRSIVFTVSVVQAEMTAEIYNRYKPGCAAFLYQGTPKDARRKIMRQFANGDIQILVNVLIVSEGVDVPAAEVCVMARPTKSLLLYQQCLDSETEILTYSGWAKMGMIRERVAAYKDGRIEWQKPKGTVIRTLHPGEKMMEYRSPCLDIRVTDGHRMLYSARSKKGWMFKEAKDFANLYAAILPISGVQDEVGITLSDDELWMLGLLTADGYFHKRNHVVVLYQNSQQPWIPEIDRIACKLGYKFCRREFERSTPFRASHWMTQWTWSMHSRKGKKHAVKLATHWETFIRKDRIAPVLELMNREQLRSFLLGLHTGDGAKHRTAYWTPKTWSIAIGVKSFADSLQSLCVRRGFKCNIAQSNFKQNPFWYAHIRDSSEADVAPKPRKDRPGCVMTFPSQPEKVWCVEVPFGAIVTRRNGKVAILGNCAGRVLRPIASCIDGLESAHERKHAIAQSTKPSALIIDLAGNAGKHHLINSGDLLGGHYSDEVRELALRKATDSQKPTDIERMLADAQFELRQKEKDLEAARRAKLTARVKYHSWSVDPFNAFSIVPRTVSNVEHGRSLSEKQRALLMKQGVDPDQYNYAQAKQLIDNFFYRWEHHLASYKQAGILKRFGIDAHEMSREQATQEIDAIAARGWRR